MKLEKHGPLQWFKYKNMAQAGSLKLNSKLTEYVDSPKEHRPQGFEQWFSASGVILVTPIHPPGDIW